jgi:predicted metal-dependent phosphoesterase TrpH
MKFDLHVHTVKSKDSALTPDGLYSAAKREGLAGVAVTDHNIFLEYPQLEDLIIIPACEYSTDGGHLLVYFLKNPIEKELTQNEKGQYSWREVIDAAHAQDAIVFIAHPFSPGIFRDIELWKALDGIEIYNARAEHSRIKDANFSAQTTCLTLDKPFSAGSDAHFAGEVGRAYWECGDFDIKDLNRSQVLGIIREKLMAGDGVVYAGTASPYYKVLSRYLSAIAGRSPVKLLRAAALFVYTAFISIMRFIGFLPGLKAGYLEDWKSIDSIKNKE